MPLHLAEINNILLLRFWVDLHDTQRCTDTKCPVEDVDTEDDRVAFRECRNGLQTTWPYCLRCRIFSFRFHYLSIVGRERVE